MKATAFKTADYLKNQKDVVAYLNAALEDGDPAVLLEALRNVAQAKGGMGALAKAAGVSRESLYRTLSRGVGTPRSKRSWNCCGPSASSSRSSGARRPEARTASE